MVDFVDTYHVESQITDASPTIVNGVNIGTPVDVTLGVHLSGWVAIDLDAAVTAVTLEWINETTGASVVGSITYDGSKLAGGSGSDGFTLEAYDSPGQEAESSYAFQVTCTGAMGASTVKGIALHARYNSPTNGNPPQG